MLPESYWPGAPFTDPAYPRELLDSHAWGLATIPGADNAAFVEHMTPAAIEYLQARLIRAKEFVAAGRSVHAFRAVCEFEAAGGYANMPFEDRVALWSSARREGYQRLMRWIAEHEARLGATLLPVSEQTQQTERLH